MAFLTHRTRIVIFIVIAALSDRNHQFSSEFQWQNCLFHGKGLLWSVGDMHLLGVDMASGKTLYTIHRRRGWQCFPVSEVSVDALQAKATATARVDVLETEVPESECHDVHEHPERSSMVPSQSWLDDWDAVQFKCSY